jgi:hypothetical protein
MRKLKKIGLWILGIVALIATVFFSTNQEPTIVLSGSGGSDVMINLTFDEDLTTDYTNKHSWTNNGASHINNRSICKWYGCANFTTSGADYLHTTANFSLTNMAVTYWVYFTEQPGQTNIQGFYEMGTHGDGSRKRSEYATYYWNSQWYASTGISSINSYNEKSATTNTWYFVFEQYNGTHHELWIDNDFYRSQSNNYGDLNQDVGEIVRVGIHGTSTSDVEGYMDEFLVFDRADFTNEEVMAMYYEKVGGTPPDMDFSVVNCSVNSDLSYKYDFTQTGNPLNMTGTIPFQCVIKNIGITNNTGNFDYDITVNNVSTCTDTLNLTPLSETTVNCAIPKTEGMINIRVILDPDDLVDEESSYGTRINNEETHNLLFTKNKFLPDINQTYIEISGTPAYDKYVSVSSGATNDFNIGDDADDVWKSVYAYNNALNCYFNDYDGASTGCIRAKNHLEGWLNSSISNWATSSPHNTHYTRGLAYLYEIMLPNMTKSEATVYAEELQNVCLAMFGATGIRPDLDDDVIKGDNGWGFGSGMAYPCIVTLGDVPSNPSSHYKDNSLSYRTNTAYSWLNRVEGHFMATNNNSGCPEGILYCNYATFNVVHLLKFNKEHPVHAGLNELLGDIEGKIISYSLLYLDNNTNGATYGTGWDSNIRWHNKGDTFAYTLIGQSDDTGAAMITLLGIMSENQTIKNIARTLRDQIYNDKYQSRHFRPMLDLYYYEELQKTTDLLSSDEITSAIGYELDGLGNLFVRQGFNRNNDNLLVFFNGEMPWGHPEAVFELYHYVKGTAFLDTPEVNTLDTERTEVWKNTLSLNNSKDFGGYTQDPWNAPLNQPYGGLSYSEHVFPSRSNYPTATYFPDSRKGYLYDTWAEPTTYTGGFRATKYYEGTNNAPERKILFHDGVMIDYYKVNRTTEGGMYFNWLHKDTDVNSTISDETLIMQSRLDSNIHYSIMPIYNTSSTSLSGGNTTIRGSRNKDGPRTLSFHYYHYNHEMTGTDEEIAFLHAWGENELPTPQILDYVGMIGVNHSGVILLLDTEGDGITYGDLETDAWGFIVYNESHIGLNDATYFFNGTANVTLPSEPYSGLFEFGAAEAEPDPEEPQPSEDCPYTSYTGQGLPLTCLRLGCSFEGMNCLNNQTRSGNAVVMS